MNGDFVTAPALLQITFGVVLVGLVIALAVIDAQKMILPNWLNVLLAAGGTGQALLLGRPSFSDAALGAVAGFSILWGLAGAFRLARGIDGMGLGDQKFAAAAGTWIGWDHIIPMLMISSCSALLLVCLLALGPRKVNLQSRLPFGPFLGLGLVVCWLTAHW